MSDRTTQIAPFLSTKLLMSASAGFMGLLGLVTSLFPREALSVLGAPPGDISVLLVKIVGTLYLGYAVLNWMARQNLIGGVYGRPVSIGNFAHFFGATVVLTKQLVATPGVTLAVGTAAYATFAVGFGSVAFSGGKSCG